jgi:large subunit ribosomal protein L19e
MDLTSQRRMASDVLGVGENRVWIDPDRVDDVGEAITKQDIRNLIESGAIQKKDESGTSKGRNRQKQEQKKAGRQKGHGSRKGSAGGRKSDKDKWKEKIRGIRKELRRMRDDGEIETSDYRKLYNMAKGGFFRNKKHMKIYIQKNIRED